MKLISGFITIALLSTCSGPREGAGSSSSPRVNIPFTPDISINEVMVAQIDHAAHFIWNAANPANAASAIDWQEVEHHAIQLIASRSAISMGGTGVNDAMWIAQTSWREYVNMLNNASLLALESARQQDVAQLSQAGDLLVESCELCHRQYKPAIPTEGFTHPH
jgi:cytochrome c556